MADLKEREVYYASIAKEQEQKLQFVKKKIFRIGSLRLLIFLAVVVVFYFFWGNIPVLIPSSIVGVVIFLALLVFHNRLFWKKDYLETQILLLENEISGINYDFSAFDGGAEFAYSEHSFSNDLDLFGNKSIFQSLNRTVTRSGRGRLASMLMNPLDDNAAILSRQKAVRELAGKSKFLIHFRTLGLIGAKEDGDEKNHPLAAFPFLKNPKLWRSIAWFVPISYAVLVSLCFLGIINGGIFLPLWFFTFVVSMLPSKSVKQIMDFFDRGKLIPSAYKELIELLENEEFQSEELKQIKDVLTKPGPASVSFKKLKSYRSNLGLSFSFPMMLIFNPYLLWNIHYALLIQKWFVAHHEDLKRWQDAVAEFDALASLGVYAFNHPDFTFPQPKEHFVFDGKKLGHPLIRASVSVKNDVLLPYEGYFLVVTGANMAGKSTYLRTVGVNQMLACCGSVVCADDLSFYPQHLVTNLRTSDSLNDNESYFFAELKRLKMIIDRLKSGEKLFIILDEILKGTNSEDKRKGSLALMRQLVKLQSNGIIATHDLELGILEAEFPEHVKNYRFEADIQDEQLTFSYEIKKGIAQNMNATFLMKQMGITGL